MKLCPALLLAATFVAGPAATSQTAIYAEFSAGKIAVSNRAWLFGPTVGLYHDNGYGLLALGYDVRGSFLRRSEASNAGSGSSLNTVEGGVRAALTPPLLPIKPYVEALAGYGGLAVGQGSARSSGGHVAYELLGGVDLTFFPRLDWRVLEFGYGRLTGRSDAFAPKSFSTGLVFRLP